MPTSAASTTLTGQIGNMIPTRGEFEIRQGATAADILNVVMSSACSTSLGANALVVERGGSTATESIYTVAYDGCYGRRKVYNISTASTAITMAASQSGGFCILGTVATEQAVTLPAQAEGMWFEFYFASSTPCASLTYIKSATADIIMGAKDADLDQVRFGEATGTAVGNLVRFVSDGTNWFMSMFPQMSSAQVSTAAYGTFGVTD